MAVWKFPIMKDRYQSVRMPQGAQALSVQNQHGDIALWALVDRNADEEDREVLVLGTGWEDPNVSKLAFVGTVQDGIYVWHVFIK